MSTDVVLGVTYAGGTNNPATPADDLRSGRPGTVTITKGNASAELTVPITNDPIVEGDETFDVTVSLPAENPPGVELSLGDATATGTITDDDRGTVSLSPPTQTATEDGMFTYTVSLSAAADEAVTVRWTATAESGDTATVADDLQAITGTVTFNAGTNADQTFTISPVNDGTAEDPERFTVTLVVDTTGGNPLPTGVTIGTNNSSTATIADAGRDTGVLNTVIYTIADAAPVDEGGTAIFEVTIAPRVLSTPQPGHPGTPVIYTAGTATLDDLGSERPTGLVFPNSATRVTLEVPIEDDDLEEGEETFTVTIDLFTNDRISIQIHATGTIRASDSPTPVTVDIADAAAVAEDAGSAAFTVSLGQAVSSDVVLGVTYAGGTDNPVTPADDLGSGRLDTVTIDQGDTEATLLVPITNDPIVEGDETFDVTVSLPAENPDGFELSLGEATATGTITDDDRGTVSLSPDEATAAENGTFSYAVSLSAAADEDVDITWTATREADQTATVAADLEATTGTVSFDAGTRVDQPFTIAVSDDDLLEPDETFTVTLSATNTLPTGITIPDATASSTATITDKRAPPTITFAAAPNVCEGGTLVYPVTPERGIG